MKKILVAGIGNIFHGDDAFGCEVIRQLKPGGLPPEIKSIDFGIRSYDLAYALNGDYDVVILVDAVGRGEAPGTLFLIEPEVRRLGELERAAVDAHAMNPVSVIQMAQSLGGVNAKLYLVGCEPAVLESEDGAMGLSAEVASAIPHALAMIESLIEKILECKEDSPAGLEAA